jgi:hypothetical protein
MALSPAHHRVLRALGETLLPSTGPGDPSGADVVPGAVEELLSAMTPADARRVGSLLTIFDLGALPRFWQPFSKLDDEKRARYVRGWMTSRIAGRRVVYRALRGLCMNAYYQAPLVWPALGYGGPLVGRPRQTGAP